ncbi:recombinase family protein [Actinomadura sp. 9N407]|uniref:recombinase family protein n=1 Tax=Actinomadura sp. 9N407 TaxID=3375154 RepID=UPI0037AEC5D3
MQDHGVQQVRHSPFSYTFRHERPAWPRTGPRDHRRPARGRTGGPHRSARRLRPSLDQGSAARPADHRAAGCIRIFADKKSGKNVEREELWKAIDYMRPGDTLVVPSLDRLARSLSDLIAIVADLRKRGIGFRSLKEALDTTTAGGRLVFHVFAALAEFIRELIIEGTNEGLAAAKARGARLGRPPAMTPEQIRHARALVTQPDATIASIARLLGVSRSTIYKYIPELKISSPQQIETDVPQPRPEIDESRQAHR